MSRKSVRFTMPNGSPCDAGPAGGAHCSPKVIEARSEEWVSNRESKTKESASGLLLDLAAERGLTEIVVLSMMMPIALSWFWLMHTIRGRMRF